LEAGLYIPPSCKGKPVATIPVATTVAKPTSSISTNPEISKTEQLKVFDALTKKIDSVYLYPDFNGLDWKSIVAKYRAKINAGVDTETFYRNTEAFMGELGDEHSSFLSPVEVKASNAELGGHNDYVGIGVYIRPMPEKGRTTLLSILPDSSAEHGGLKPHDSILAIDGVPIAENGIDYSLRVRGPECSAVTLRIQSPGEQPRDQTFIRYHITGGISILARLVTTTDGSRIGYILIPSFFDDTIPKQIKKALQDFGDLDGLILDNRMNGGGSSSVVYPIFGYFTSGTIGHFVSRTSTDPLTITADPVGNSQEVPLVVLVGTDTVSFGEIFSGALQDLGRAKVVGQTTLGNVETLNGYNFDDGSQAWIATDRFDPLNSHADWEKTGIIPDVEAYADWDTFTFETDPSVAAAVKLLGHK
jgi:carboxyl-terminal processing protease